MKNFRLNYVNPRYWGFLNEYIKHIDPYILYRKEIPLFLLKKSLPYIDILMYIRYNQCDEKILKIFLDFIFKEQPFHFKEILKSIFQTQKCISVDHLKLFICNSELLSIYDKFEIYNAYICNPKSVLDSHIKEFYASKSDELVKAGCRFCLKNLTQKYLDSIGGGGFTKLNNFQQLYSEDCYNSHYKSSLIFSKILFFQNVLEERIMGKR